jgi:hypothetical protein
MESSRIMGRRRVRKGTTREERNHSKMIRKMVVGTPSPCCTNKTTEK